MAIKMASFLPALVNISKNILLIFAEPYLYRISKSTFGIIRFKQISDKIICSFKIINMFISIDRAFSIIFVV